jgi:integrase
MAKTLTEAALTTRNARQKLSQGLHWRQVDVDIYLGYRKGVGGSRWLVRWYLGSGGYKQETLGVADDVISEGTLSFDAACRAAREHVRQVRARIVLDAALPPETVRTSVESYIAMRDDRIRLAYPNSKRRSDGASRLTRYVLNDAIADTALPDLTEAMLANWKQRLAPHCAPGSRVRTMNDLKAALNFSHRNHRKRLPADFSETIRWGLACDKTVPAVRSRARENQILPDETVRDIVAAAASYDEDGDVGRMILMLAATGARFSQIQRVTVGDVQADRSRIFMPASRKGQGKEDTSYPVQVGTDVVGALRPVLDGLKPDEPLLCRWRMKQTKQLKWERDYRGPSTSAAEMTRQWRDICNGLGLEGVVPYALRHSSIVRAIRAGLPIRLVAAMHDTSVSMIERHYARYIVDGLEEIAARAVIPIVRHHLRVVV